MDIKLRPAGPADLHEIMSWIPDARAMKLWAGPGHTFPPRPDRLWAEIKGDPQTTFVLVRDETLIAFGQRFLRQGDTLAHLARLIVAPSFRGRGYGRLLCLRLMALPVPPTVRFYSLNVDPANTPARNLYHALGFRPAPRQPRSEVIFMVLPIAHPASPAGAGPPDPANPGPC